MLGLELATFLAAAPQSMGTVNTTLFYNFVPPDPDVLIAVVEYGGEADEPDLGIDGTKTRYEFKRFQVIARGIQNDNDGPALKCQQAKNFLVSVLNASLSGVRYVGIDCLTPPSPLMMDANFRHYWVSNMRAIKAPSPS